MVSQLECPVVSQLPHWSIEGLVQVFTCPQRSFFTGVIAQALRIAGQGTPVLVVQFLKGGIGQGVDRPIQLAQSLDWFRCNLAGCVDTPQVSPADAAAITELWRYTQDVVLSGRYDLVVLDELSVAIRFGLVPECEVLELIDRRPKHVDVILTGPDMPDGILDVADQITELRRGPQP